MPENPPQASVIGGPPDVAPPIRYCIYCRKSSEAAERQALSIESQAKEMLDLAAGDGLEVVEVRREAHSAKDSGQRPVFNEILADIRRGRFNGLLAWAPDRLSRNAGDLGSVVDLMDQKLLAEIRTHGQIFRNSPNEKFLLMILCSQGKLENDQKGLNVKRGLRARCEMGLWPAQAPTGYLNENRADRRGYVQIDPERAPVVRQMFEKVAYEKWSGRKVYHWLRFTINLRTALGNKHLTLSNVHLILQNHFYSGTFEYPRGSGAWYRGRHEPIVTKELFDATQAQLKRDSLTNREDKEFAFTRLMTCGLCGSGITADQKVKTQKNGKVHRYVYYCCTKSRDKNCACGYTREEDLIRQFVNIVEGVDINKVAAGTKLSAEIERFQHFQSVVLGKSREDGPTPKPDIRSFARYVLEAGSILEKRELLGCVKSPLKLANGVVSIVPASA